MDILRNKKIVVTVLNKLGNSDAIISESYDNDTDLIKKLEWVLETLVSQKFKFEEITVLTFKSRDKSIFRDNKSDKFNNFNYIKRINVKTIDLKWREKLVKSKLYRNQSKSKKFYCLEMFPYPSGKIHMGHVRNYTIGDVIARYKYMCGYNVLHPMGWDAFGLPAENAAKENNLHPKKWTLQNIEEMKRQLKLLSLSVDWDTEISTCDENYYTHQQSIFIDLYNNGFVSRKETYVNWDPKENTVLANEQVINGKGWRSGVPVERKKLNQWFFNISKFSEQLLDGLEDLSEWPNKVKTMQKNWIGKSLGCEIKFNLIGSEEKLTVFTTRPDTIFGATFIAVSINHKIVSDVFDKISIEFLNASELVSLSRARMREPMAVRGRLAPEFPVYPKPPLSS